jgi:acetyl-CoA acetyltransferase
VNPFDRVAIVGVGTTNFGADYRQTTAPRSAYDLAIDAFTQALTDSALDKSDIDGLIGVRVPSYGQCATDLGLYDVRLAWSLEGTGRMAGVALQQAATAIATGQARVIAILYGNNGRSAGEKYGGRFDDRAPGAWDAMVGMTSPGAYVALMHRAHQHAYGTQDNALAAIALSNRDNATRNPVAVMRTPLSAEEYFSSPYIAEPLRKLDYCLINDGGVCIILAERSFAKRRSRRPVRLLASANAANLRQHYASTDFFYDTCTRVAAELLAQSGLTPGDVDCLQAYDNFTPTVLYTLEGFGFCPRGESGKWVSGGRIALGGELPINTAGGHTAEGYMQGFALQVEAIRQARGEAGERQVPNCSVVQYACVSPIVNAHLFTAES